MVRKSTKTASIKRQKDVNQLHCLKKMKAFALIWHNYKLIKKLKSALTK